MSLSNCSSGGGQVIIVTSPSGYQYPNPDNIVVGVASDLAVQVSCSSSNNMETFTWMHQNGTEITLGLEPFGTSQGDGGTLRIYPASLLGDGGTYICSSNEEGNSMLNVTFTTGMIH